MAEFDKYKSCKDCPDRTAIPNCHDDCEGYFERCKKQRAIAQKQKQKSDFDRYVYESIEKTKKWYKNHKKGRRK